MFGIGRKKKAPQFGLDVRLMNIELKLVNLSDKVDLLGKVVDILDGKIDNPKPAFSNPSPFRKKRFVLSVSPKDKEQIDAIIDNVFDGFSSDMGTYLVEGISVGKNDNKPTRTHIPLEDLKMELKNGIMVQTEKSQDPAGQTEQIVQNSPEVAPQPEVPKPETKSGTVPEVRIIKLQ